MKRLSFLCLILLFSYNSEARNETMLTSDDFINKSLAKTDSLEKTISLMNQNYSTKHDSLLKELSLTKEKYDYIITLNTQTTNSISNQLEAVPISLTVFGVLFAVAAVILGVYVTRIENKIITLKGDTQKLLNETISTRDEVKGINKLIQRDIKGLYEKIKREETVHILDRLVNVPDDIGNLINPLLSRKLEKEDYFKLKEAYLKLDEEDRKFSEETSFFSLDRGGQYLLIFFQHFLDLLIVDSDIGKDAIAFYPTGIKCAFRNDMDQATKDLMYATSNTELGSLKDELSSFMKGLSLSKHKDYKIVYEIIFEKLNDRKKQFDFFNIIEKNKEVRFALVQYGELLEYKYVNEDLNDLEKSVFEYLAQIREELKEEEKSNPPKTGGKPDQVRVLGV